MWPRGDATAGPGADITMSRRSKSAGLSGFISYMKRRDAEACVREMDGFDWGGSILRVGWSKAVPVAPRAAYGAFNDSIMLFISCITHRFFSISRPCDPAPFSFPLSCSY